MKNIFLPQDLKLQPIGPSVLPERAIKIPRASAHGTYRIGGAVVKAVPLRAHHRIALLIRVHEVGKTVLIDVITNAIEHPRNVESGTLVALKVRRLVVISVPARDYAEQ